MRALGFYPTEQVSLFNGDFAFHRRASIEYVPAAREISTVIHYKGILSIREVDVFEAIWSLHIAKQRRTSKGREVVGCQVGVTEGRRDGERERGKWGEFASLLFVRTHGKGLLLAL